MVVTGPGVEYHTGASGFVIRAVFARKIKISNRRAYERVLFLIVATMIVRNDVNISRLVVRLSARGMLRVRSTRRK
jgi:hypothetical protein